MNVPLREKRRQIDAVDVKLSVLLAERLSLAASLAGLKKKVRDPRREALILERAAGRIGDRALRAAVLAVYRELLKQGRSLQSAARSGPGRRGSGSRDKSESE